MGDSDVEKKQIFRKLVGAHTRVCFIVPLHSENVFLCMLKVPNMDLWQFHVR